MTTTTPDLTTLTPPEIDGQLAELYEAQLVADQRLGWAIDALHYAVGDKKERIPGSYRDLRAWTLTENECLDAEDRVPAYNRRDFAEAVANIADYRRQLADLAAQAEVRNAEWLRRDCWSRFFLVDNDNGHIHRSMSCQTCNREGRLTRFWWLPHLSGLSEAEAVADQGEILCTVCFPSAPSAWTEGVSKKTLARSAERDRAKAERAAKKLEKALLPDGQDLIVVTDGGRRHRIGTLRAAKMWLTDAAEWGRDYPRPDHDGTMRAHHPSYPPDAVAQVAVAVAAKTGDTPDEVRAQARRRADKRARY